jgi:hypothetical protein
MQICFPSDPRHPRSIAFFAGVAFASRVGLRRMNGKTLS